MIGVLQDREENQEVEHSGSDIKLIWDEVLYFGPQVTHSEHLYVDARLNNSKETQS